ncbi:5272_t:CDS:2, partial [Gigaspora margarita]
MSTSSRAETLAATNWRNVNSQRKTDEQDDLIHFEPREYDDVYAFSTYPKYTSKTTISMPIYYEVQLNEEEENNEHIVITDPDDVPVLSLHDVAIDNHATALTLNSRIETPDVLPIEVMY